MSDPEIRDLQIATARAYAIAERLAYELEATVQDLLEHVGHSDDDVSDDVERRPNPPRRRQ